jgi:hypothetical protein
MRNKKGSPHSQRYILGAVRTTEYSRVDDADLIRNTSDLESGLPGLFYFSYIFILTHTE